MELVKKNIVLMIHSVILVVCLAFVTVELYVMLKYVNINYICK